MIRKIAILAALGMAVGIGGAQAQEPGLNPSYGSIKLTSGFEPDPYVLDMLAGGSEDASALGGSCWGIVANEPDLKVFFSPGDLPLTFNVLSETDTTLVVYGPDGSWICDDDSGEGLNPSITLNEPLSGEYQIWVGTFSEGDLVDATLEITELAPPIQMLDWSLEPNYGSIDYNAEFETEPYMLEMEAGGDIEVQRALPECRGYATLAPDFRVNYTAGSDPLVISATSDTDTTLIVSDPEGAWICDDDSGGSSNPQLTFDAPLSGQYDIWVGTYSEGPIAAATLYFGSRAASGSGGALNWDLPPNYGEVSLSAGFSPDPYVVNLVAGGNADASTVGDECWGYVTEAPDFRLFYEGADGPLTFAVTSDADTTLVVADPDGGWHCNDDTNGFDPEVTFDLPIDGQYDVWVGTFSAGQNSDATLSISDAGNAAASGEIDWSLDPAYGNVELSSGFLPDPYTVEVTAGGSVPASTVDDSCYGSVTAEPTFRLYYEGGAFPLYIWVDSDDDTTLLISDPVGNWVCDDDGGTIPFQPALAFDAPETGQYDIWVGRFGGGTTDATIYISETENAREDAEPVEPAVEPAEPSAPEPDEPSMPDEPAEPSAPEPDEPSMPGEPAEPAPDVPVFIDYDALDWTLPAAAEVTLSAGFSPDPTTVEVEAGGPVAAETVDASCYGSVSNAPAVKLSYTADAWPLILSVESEADTTLLIRTPDGAWICDDDSGEDLNPSITLDVPATGDYAVWVGAFGDDSGPATLYISEVSSR